MEQVIFFGLKSGGLDTKCVSRIYKIVTKTNSYNIYGKILFQKVALGYELHLVQQRILKKRLKTCIFAQIYQTPTIFKNLYINSRYTALGGLYVILEDLSGSVDESLTV